MLLDTKGIDMLDRWHKYFFLIPISQKMKKQGTISRQRRSSANFIVSISDDGNVAKYSGDIQLRMDTDISRQNTKRIFLYTECLLCRNERLLT